MQNQGRGLLSMLESYFDMLINLLAVLMSYVFVVMVFEPVLSLDSIEIIILIFIHVLLTSFVYHAFNMYKPMRYAKPYRSLPLVLKSNTVYFGILAVLTAFSGSLQLRKFVLFWLLFTFVISTCILTFKRHTIKVVLRSLRSRQYHLRKVIIVGDNINTAGDFAKEVASNSQYGMMVIGYVGNKNTEDIGAEKLGSFKDLAKILDKYRPTDVVFAIDSYDKWRLIKLVNMCDDRCIKVYFLPVIYGFFKNSRQIEQVGSLPTINIHSTPLDNPVNAMMKRIVDVVGSAILIVLTSPIMLGIAIGVKISSPGPVFFKQKRVGKMGKQFTMMKFRSMRDGKEKNRTWSTGVDSRKTKFGNFIRKTSLDELPQLFNVFVGSMSLVGPRPEIPVFVEKFKEIIPLYMVKHYVKPGMTGLAQVKGLRGDTSVEDRIHEDIAYIENWSLMLDFYILFKTPFKAINHSEKYIEPTDKEENIENTNLEAPPRVENNIDVMSVYYGEDYKCGNEENLQSSGSSADTESTTEQKLEQEPGPQTESVSPEIFPFEAVRISENGVTEQQAAQADCTDTQQTESAECETLNAEFSELHSTVTEAERTENLPCDEPKDTEGAPASLGNDDGVGEHGDTAEDNNAVIDNAEVQSGGTSSTDLEAVAQDVSEGATVLSDEQAQKKE